MNITRFSTDASITTVGMVLLYIIFRVAVHVFLKSYIDHELFVRQQVSTKKIVIARIFASNIVCIFFLAVLYFLRAMVDPGSTTYMVYSESIFVHVWRKLFLDNLLIFYLSFFVMTTSNNDDNNHIGKKHTVIEYKKEKQTTEFRMLILCMDAITEFGSAFMTWSYWT